MTQCHVTMNQTINLEEKKKTAIYRYHRVLVTITQLLLIIITISCINILSYREHLR